MIMIMIVTNMLKMALRVGKTLHRRLSGDSTLSTNHLEKLMMVTVTMTMTMTMMLMLTMLMLLVMMILMLMLMMTFVLILLETMILMLMSPPQAVMMNNPNVTLTTARLDQGASIRPEMIQILSNHVSVL